MNRCDTPSCLFECINPPKRSICFSLRSVRRSHAPKQPQVNNMAADQQPHKSPRRFIEPLLVVLLAVLLQASRAFVPCSSPINPSSSRPPALESGGEGTTRLWMSSQPPERLTISEQLKLSPNRWKRSGQSLEPGVGGIWPGKPDAKTYKVRACVRVCVGDDRSSQRSEGARSRVFGPGQGQGRAGGNDDDAACPLTGTCMLACTIPLRQVTVRDPRTNTNYTMDVPEDRYIFWAFEDAGIDLPMVNGHRMCRNGACTTCAVKVMIRMAGYWSVAPLPRSLRPSSHHNQRAGSSSHTHSPRNRAAGRGQGEDGGRAGPAPRNEGS